MGLSSPAGAQPPSNISWGVSVIKGHSSLSGLVAQTGTVEGEAPGFIEMNPLCALFDYPDPSTAPSGSTNSFITIIEDREPWREICERKCDSSLHTITSDCEWEICDEENMRATLQTWSDPVLGRKLISGQIEALIDQFSGVCTECQWTGDRAELREQRGFSHFNYTTGWSGSFFWNFRDLGMNVPAWNPVMEYTAGSLVRMVPCWMSNTSRVVRNEDMPLNTRYWSYGCNPPFDGKYYIAQSGSSIGPSYNQAYGQTVFDVVQNIDSLYPVPEDSLGEFGYAIPYRNDPNWIPRYITVTGSGIPGTDLAFAEQAQVRIPSGGNGTNNWTVIKNMTVTGYRLKNIPGGFNTGIFSRSPDMGASNGEVYGSAFGDCTKGHSTIDCTDPANNSLSSPSYWGVEENPYWEEVTEEWIADNLGLASTWFVEACCSSSGTYNMSGETLGGCVSDTSRYALLTLYNNPP